VTSTFFELLHTFSQKLICIAGRILRARCVVNSRDLWEVTRYQPAVNLCWRVCSQIASYSQVAALCINELCLHLLKMLTPQWKRTTSSTGNKYRQCSKLVFWKIMQMVYINKSKCLFFTPEEEFQIKSKTTEKALTDVLQHRTDVALDCAVTPLC